MWSCCINQICRKFYNVIYSLNLNYKVLPIFFFYLQEDIISVWNRAASDQATTNRIRDTLRRVLNLPPNTILEYKNHGDSLKYGMHGIVASLK